jgi:hypothetical protein
MDYNLPITLSAPRPITSSSDLCFDVLDTILSHLPRSILNTLLSHTIDSNLMCAGVCNHWLVVSRRYAYWCLKLGEEEEAQQFLAALVSNEAFAERNPGWPRMNSTRYLVLEDVSGM